MVGELYSKHILKINGIEFNVGNNITYERDLEELFINLSVNIPYIKDRNCDLTNIKKYDKVELYYDEFYNSTEAYNATTNDLHLLIKGYIDKNEKELSKDSGWQQSLTIKSNTGLFYERSSTVNILKGNLRNSIELGLTQSNLWEKINDLVFVGVNQYKRLDIESSEYIGEVLDNIREKYALYIYESPKNDLIIQAPFYLTQQSTVEAYEFRVDENVYNLQLGDVTNKVDTVVAVGNGTFGVAFDPIAYQLKFGTEPENLESSPRIKPDELNIRYVYRRDVFSQVELQEIAQNKIAELAKNNTISFDTKFIPEMNLGDPVVVRGTDEIYPNQLWIVKNISFDLSKDSNVATITCYSNSIVDFPEDILIGANGLLSLSTLGQQEKVNDSLNLRD